jgi:Ser/Thr protein kinase RdoA (MazF antagonist)
MRYGLAQSNRGSYADRTAFPAQSSVLDEEALFHRVVPQYKLPAPGDCLFLERGDSDVYVIHTAGPTFYLKIYRPPHPTARAEMEGRLVADLLRYGASVVPAVARLDGAFATELSASEGPRAALVFEEAPPLRLDPGDDGACRRLGAAVARLHAAGDVIGSRLSQSFIELDLLPFAERLAYPEDYVALQDLRERVRGHLLALTDGASDPDVGWCHNDLALCNIRCREDGAIVFFDFGNAAVTRRSNELVRIQGALRRDGTAARFHEIWAAFVDGYGQVRPVPEIAWHPEQALLVGALRRIHWIGGVMASCPLRMGTETFNREWVRTQLRSVQESVRPVLGEDPR